MAKAIEIRPRPTPAGEQIQRKLDAAPKEHAEAVLDAYRTLQTLHDTDTLSFVRGLLGAGDKVLSEVVSVATSPQSTRAIRNLLVLTDLLGTVSPDTLHRVASTVTPVLTEPQPAEPPSLLVIGWRLATSKDVHRALAIGVAVLEAVGQALGPGNTKSSER
jgi:uncharacterized protein YjgD (DUF1641 family)